MDHTEIRSFLKTHLGPSWKSKPLAGDSGERHYNRIICPNGNFIFVHYPSSKKGLTDFLIIQNLLKEKNIYVPKIFHINKQRGWMIIEDIGSLSLEQYYIKHKNLFYHKKSLDQLHQLQHLLKRKELSKIFKTDQSLNEMLMAYQQLNLPISDEEKNKLLGEFQAISQSLADSDLIPSHRDFHSRNLFIYQNNIYMIDFQDAGLYPFYYDLVSFIYDSYIHLSFKEQNQLIEHYNKTWNHIYDPYLLKMTFCQRGLKAIGSFISFYSQRGQKTHLQYIRPTLKRIHYFLSELNQFPHYLAYTKNALKRLKDVA